MAMLREGKKFIRTLIGKRWVFSSCWSVVKLSSFVSKVVVSLFSVVKTASYFSWSDDAKNGFDN